MKTIKKTIALLLLLVAFAAILTGCQSNEEPCFEKFEDFEHARIGVLTGSSFDLLARRHFPEAEKVSYVNMTDLLLNLEQGKIDGILMDQGFFAPLLWESRELSSVPMDMIGTQYAVAFPKTPESEPLKAQIDEFIRKHTADGGLDELKEKWLGGSEPECEMDLSQLTGENGTLRVATTVESKPFDYLRNGNLCGFDMDFIFRFAKEYGYALEMDTMDFSGLLPSLSAGRYDLAISSITVTEERKESVLFSQIYCSSDIVMAVQSKNTSAGKTMTLADMETATIGIVTGTSWDLVVQRELPNAERKYFGSSADVLLAVGQGKVDAFFADKTVYAGMRWENSAIDYIDEPLETVDNALIFAKNGYDEALLGQMNAFIAKCKEDGTLDQLDHKWFGKSEPTEHPDYTKLTGENGTIRVAIGDAHKPVSYQIGSMYTGYEVEFLTLFAQEYGYKLDLQGMKFEALIPTVSSGKCDIGACGITITPERAESVLFTDPHIETYGVAIVRNEAVASGDVKSLDDYKDATIGAQTGSVFVDYAKDFFPDATYQYYTLMSDIILAMSQGKIDAALADITYVTAALWEGVDIEVVGKSFANTKAGFILPPGSEGSEVYEQLNAFIMDAKINGLLAELEEKWLGAAEPTEFFDQETLTGENGTLKVIVVPDLKPLCYVKNGVLVGYDVEVLQHFAKEYGYALELVSGTFDAVLPGVASAKYDIGAGGITITEERAKSITFTESYLTNDMVLIVNGQNDSAEKNAFLDSVKESFDKTFIREDRWKLIAKGVGVTVLISLSAAVTGSLLGFGLYMLSRSNRKLIRLVSRGIAKVYSRIVAGTPIVVILMILFYVIFGKVRDMSGIVVAIIGFTLTFGAFVYDHMTVSVGSVDHGQTEAAYALGYTRNGTFFRIIFPQAMKIFLPSYCGQAVELIKATAVVGYVAVNDLTKMGDIIRSNTYEAFFPLISTAVIYFLLTWLLSLLLKLVKLRFEPKRRSKEEILKGVKIS